MQKGLQAAAASASASTSAKGKAAGASMKETGSSSRLGGRKDGTRGTKRGREEVCRSAHKLASYANLTDTLCVQDESHKKPDMKLNVPEILKALLVDDWEAVTKNNQVCVVSCSYKHASLTPSNSSLRFPEIQP